MTAKELSGLFYLDKEIEYLKRELASLRDKNFYKPNVVSDMPKGTGVKDSNLEYISNIIEIENKLKETIKKRTIERNRICEFISLIEDDEIRLIVYMRVVKQLDWYVIGTKLSMDRRTASRKYYRYLERCPQCP